MSESEEPGEVAEPVTTDDLVQLMSEELTADEEARLRMRMARDPNAQRLLERLQGVDELLDRPPRHELSEIPADVEARLAAHVSNLARQRAEGALDDVHAGPPPTGPQDDRRT